MKSYLRYGCELLPSCQLRRPSVEKMQRFWLEFRRLHRLQANVFEYTRHMLFSSQVDQSSSRYGRSRIPSSFAHLPYKFNADIAVPNVPRRRQPCCQVAVVKSCQNPHHRWPVAWDANVLVPRCIFSVDSSKTWSVESFVFIILCGSTCF
jgi:hypothetical protein